MAPSSGHILVPKVLRIVKFAIHKTSSLIRAKLPHSSTTNNASLQPIRIYAQNQPIHPLAYLKQSRSQNNNRCFSTTARALTSSPAKARTGVKYDRSAFPTSNVSRAISQRGSVPFASTLRPNLTGGALPRSAGGYSLGGAGKGARHFSHTSGTQAQVIHNVSAAIRAFCVGGGKARFDGVDPITGEKRFRSVSQTEDAVYTQWETPLSSSTRGTNIEFKISPTITAFCPSFSAQTPDCNSPSLHAIDLLSTLTSDFARALQDLSLTLADLRALSAFGDLPIALTHTPAGPILTVRFPGCDADLVSRLCDEVGVKRGVVVEDEAWHGGARSFGKAGRAEKDVEMALLFPFAPLGSPSSSSLPSVEGGEFYFSHPPQRQQRHPEQLDWRSMLSPSRHSQCTAESAPDGRSHDDAPLKSPDLPTSGYESLRESDFASEDPYLPTASPVQAAAHGTRDGSAEYEGLEGIYRFLQVCEEARR
ncbi:hypothetical protein IMSHALPRED_008425 [Imshaugia aleurites]|uniref:Uncharacterized protein n=1 Tax=Imshaugia aleurites TaxID=172621 RepID=A0A8H3I932_9LECA|nr:hypothetical protein IMSHALPRED_008425 [Imshaugia aleurites]